MSDLLMDTELTYDQRGWVEAIRRSGENLLELINDILDFSKIETGKIRLEAVDFDLFAVVNEVTDLVALRAQEKGIQLLVALPTHGPRFLRGDPGRLRQVLLNLTGNAVKFTETGSVVIRLALHQSAPDRFRVTFAVEDTGIGVPADKLAYIFDKFAQAEEATTRKFGGTGLGLAISKGLVNLMGGTMDVVSQLGKGSQFSFTVPLTLAETQSLAALAISDVDLRNMRILIVDDCVPSVEIMKAYAASWGMKADSCAALGVAKEALSAGLSGGNPYAFILCETKIGSAESKDLLNVVAQVPLAQRPFVLLVTAYSQMVSSEAAALAGFSGYFLKPFFPDHLKGAMQLLVEARREGEKMPLVTRPLVVSMAQSSRPQRTIRPNMFPHVRALVVEDMKINLMLIVKILEKHGCEVLTAMNGREAVSLLSREKVDIVFMDCQMPEMDGFEATMAIRETEKTSGAHVPIVALTADAMIGDREKCLRAGMDDYLNKPLRQEQITKILTQWLGSPK